MDAELQARYDALTPADFQLMFADELKRIGETGCLSFMDAKVVEKCYPESIYWGLRYYQVTT